MANIRTLNDYRQQPSFSGSSQQSSYRPVYVSGQQGSLYQQGPYQDPPGGGISIMSPKDPMDPSMSQRCFPWMSLYTFTAFISILDVIMFIITLIVGGTEYDGAIVKGNSMLGPSSATLKGMGGKWEPDIRNDGAIWRLFTPIVLHAGLIHLLSNLFFQLRFGFVLEARWTIPRFIVTYIATGVGASFLSCIKSPYSVSVGASGALFGVIGADVTYLMYNWAKIPHNKMEACMLTFVIVVNFLFGLGDNVDNWAHLGGLVTGLFIGCSLPEPIDKKPRELLYRTIAGVGCALLFLLFALLLWVGNPE